MVFGGVPYYLSMLESTKHDCLAQNIDELLFHPDGQLHRDFIRESVSSHVPQCRQPLTDSKSHGCKEQGLTRNEILEQVLQAYQMRGVRLEYWMNWNKVTSFAAIPRSDRRNATRCINLLMHTPYSIFIFTGWQEQRQTVLGIIWTQRDKLMGWLCL